MFDKLAMKYTQRPKQIVLIVFLRIEGKNPNIILFWTSFCHFLSEFCLNNDRGIINPKFHYTSLIIVSLSIVPSVLKTFSFLQRNLIPLSNLKARRILT